MTHKKQSMGRGISMVSLFFEQGGYSEDRAQQAIAFMTGKEDKLGHVFRRRQAGRMYQDNLADSLLAANQCK